MSSGPWLAAILCITIHGAYTVILHHLLNLAEDFAASMAAFVIWTHYDFEGWWEQRRIEHGRRLEEKQR
jgi:hypothetical protein